MSLSYDLHKFMIDNDIGTITARKLIYLEIRRLEEEAVRELKKKFNNTLFDRDYIYKEIDKIFGDKLI